MVMLKPLIEREERASAWMQTRLLDLLLRYDKALFDSYFNERKALASSHPELRRYRDIAVLLRLRDELFDYILPQIVRRLSFDAPRSTQIEEHPVSGQIDWERTLSASWESFPDKPPLQLYTRQNRRSFATPENMLTVLTLLEYKRNIDQMLGSSDPFMQGQQLRSQLLTIAEQCERELSFPQFAGLREAAQSLLDQQHDSELAERLELLVSEHLLPGANNAYHELLIWREKLRKLEMVRMYSRGEVLTLGPDLEQQSRLYQIWVLYELLEFLSLEDRVIEHQSDQSEAQRGLLRFQWGSPDTLCEYELLFNPELASQWQGDLLGQPTFLLRRSDRHELRDGDELIWHEPGFLLDAVYQQAASPGKLLDQARKRLIGELHVSGEQRAIVLVPFVSQEHDQLSQAYPPETRLSNPTGELQIAIRQLSPLFEWRSAGNAQAPSLQNALRELLEHVHQSLVARRVPICQGVFLDTLSVKEASSFIRLIDPKMLDEAQDLLICPKQHISLHRIDIVSRNSHCCQDARYCHIINQVQAIKPIRPPRSAEDLLHELQHLYSNADVDEFDDELVSSIVERVQEMTRRFAELTGFHSSLNIYFNRLRDLGMEHTFDLLSREDQESLALGIYIQEQLDNVRAKDFSAPAIHISSVLELAIKKRVFSCRGLQSEVAYHTKQTLGKLPHMRRKPNQFNGDWDRITNYVAQNWKQQCHPEREDIVIKFTDLLDDIPEIATTRNNAAHTNIVTRAEYRKLLQNTLQAGTTQVGVLNALLLAWQTNPGS
jgi:hypothetical protein